MFDNIAYHISYREKNRNEINRKMREYSRRNKEKIKIIRQSEEYREKVNKRDRENRKLNPEKYRDKENKYKNKNTIKYLLIDIKKRSKKQNIIFSLIESDVVVNCICPLLEIPIIKNDGYKTGNSPSLDRIFPELGYIKNNILYISNKANSIKSNLSINEIEMLNKNYFNINNIKNNDNINYCLKQKQLFAYAKHRAKIKNLEFCIKWEDIIIPQRCPLLDIDIILTNTAVKENSPSLDRIDNNKGYTKSNIRVISFKANTSKNSSTKEEYDLLAKNLRKIINGLNNNE